MAGSPGERVARWCEKVQKRKLAVTQDHSLLRSPGQPELARSSGPSCLGDLPGPSSQPFPFQLAEPSDPLLVSRKRTRGRSLMDFPATIAALNRRRRVRVMHCSTFPDQVVPMPVTLPLDRAHVEEMKAVDKTINNGTAPYVFKINGVVHHRIGSLMPHHGSRPKFAQLYTYDTEHEAQNRLGMFECKKNELLVTVTIKKIDNSWWYNACKKCMKTAKRHGDSYKCMNPRCGAIRVPTQRFKLSILAGDETGGANFILFGRQAQRLVKKTADTLVADNPVGFIPDELTRLLEKNYKWSVSFTDNTTDSDKTTFQVNAVVGEVNNGGAVIPATPGASQTSSIMCSEDATTSLQNTDNALTISSLPAAFEASLASSAAPTKAAMDGSGAADTPQSKGTMLMIRTRLWLLLQMYLLIPPQRHRKVLQKKGPVLPLTRTLLRSYLLVKKLEMALVAVTPCAATSDQNSPSRDA